jgi:hypothetical protein
MSFVASRVPGLNKVPMIFGIHFICKTLELTALDLPARLPLDKVPEDHSGIWDCMS